MPQLVAASALMFGIDMYTKMENLLIYIKIGSKIFSIINS